jgi:Kef-type K+ transport system membrane component KefB
VTFSRLGAAEFGGANALFISDSLYVSLLSQAGLIFLLCFLAFNVLLFKKAWQHRCQGMNPVAIMMIPAALVVSLGGNVLEFFPASWLLCIVYGAVLRQAHDNAGHEARTASEASECHPCRHEVLA